MNAKTANRLAKVINQTSGYRVTGTRFYFDVDDYALDIVETRTGQPSVINNPQEFTDLTASRERAYWVYAAEER